MVYGLCRSQPISVSLYQLVPYGYPIKKAGREVRSKTGVILDILNFRMLYFNNLQPFLMVNNYFFITLAGY
jgi:hypothetical protein